MLFNFAAVRRAGLESLCGSCSNRLVLIGLKSFSRRQSESVSSYWFNAW